MIENIRSSFASIRIRNRSDPHYFAHFFFGGGGETWTSATSCMKALHVIRVKGDERINTGTCHLVRDIWCSPPSSQMSSSGPQQTANLGREQAVGGSKSIFADNGISGNLY